jgi:hypothetical protein
MSREVTNISGSKRRLEVDGEINDFASNLVAEVNDVVSNLVSKVEEASFQNLPQEKKRYKRYKTAESRQQRDIENHPLLPGCPSSCPKKCSKNFTEDVRAKINQYYWGLSMYNGYLIWLKSLIPLALENILLGKRKDYVLELTSWKI